jgi:hypothetical protein
MLFSSVAGMYGFQMLGLFLTQLNGYHLKVFGDICLFDVFLGLVQMGIFARYAKEARLGAIHHLGTQYALAAWVALSLCIWGTTHDYVPAKVTGVVAFAAVVGTLYSLIYLGGLLDPPGEPRKEPAPAEDWRSSAPDSRERTPTPGLPSTNGGTPEHEMSDGRRPSARHPRGAPAT